jgi:signal transduction histidine kinase
MNIRLNITLLFSLLVMCILAALSYAVYYFTENNRQENFKTRLESGAANRAYLFTVLESNPVSILRKLDKTAIPVVKKRTFLIYDELGKLVYEYNDEGAHSFLVNAELLDSVKKNGKLFFAKNDLNVAAVYHQFNQQKLIVFYAGIDIDGKQRLKDLQHILAYSLLFGVIITLIVGYIFSTQLVKPIKQIVKEVNEISFNNLSERINWGNGQDELSNLANTFNDLLNRIQESSVIQRRFISNASHELSTPLTSIYSQVQVTLQKERNPDEYRAVLQSVQEDVEQMRQLTKSLLEVAKTGYEGGLELSEVRIDEIVLRIVSDTKKLNTRYEIDLEFGEFPDEDKATLTYGNPDLLYSAIKNIVENGCKFSSTREVFVSLHFENNKIQVAVKNFGRLIPDIELENIFHPFYRGSTATDIRGFGLGLALAKRIILLHKGTIKVRSTQEQGTVFSVELPSLASY